jgi:ABC exporter DevB family membrane fusion protein
MKFIPSDKSGGRCLLWIVLTITVTASFTIIYKFLPFDQFFSQSKSISKTSVIQTDDLEVPEAIAALGILEPQGEVIVISAPAFAEGARVDRLLVKRGDQVRAGQVIAILDSRPRLEAALKKAQTQVLVAQTQLALVKAGAKQGEINAQKAQINNLKAELSGQVATQRAAIEQLQAELKGEKEAQQATIERLKAEWDNAKTECDRYQSLYQDGAVNASDRDRKCLEQETASKRLTEVEVNLTKIIASGQEQINEAEANRQRTINTLSEQQTEAKATLNKIAEVRPIDILVAQVNIKTAQASVDQAKAELDLAYVRVPKAGQILQIYTWPGELVNNKGIVQFGQTTQMYVKAEVYETDISQVRVGQRATITSQGFQGKLQGTVDEIGLSIGKKDILGTDPVADVDSRVVEVKIRLDSTDNRKVSHLSNLQVQVVIDTSSQNSHKTKKTLSNK